MQLTPDFAIDTRYVFGEVQLDFMSSLYRLLNKTASNGRSQRENTSISTALITADLQFAY